MVLIDIKNPVIKWGLIILLVIGLIICIVFLINKKSNTDVTINLKLKGPFPTPQTATVKLNKSIL